MTCCGQGRTSLARATLPPSRPAPPSTRPCRRELRRGSEAFGRGAARSGGLRAALGGDAALSRAVADCGPRPGDRTVLRVFSRRGGQARRSA